MLHYIFIFLLLLFSQPVSQSDQPPAIRQTSPTYKTRTAHNNRHRMISDHMHLYLCDPREIPIQFRSTAPAAQEEIKRKRQRRGAGKEQRTKIIFKTMQYCSPPDGWMDMWRRRSSSKGAPGHGRQGEESTKKKLISERKHISPSFHVPFGNIPRRCCCSWLLIFFSASCLVIPTWSGGAYLCRLLHMSFDCDRRLVRNE